MKWKSDSYHLDIQIHRGKPYGLLRNSYREDGKVKKETLCRLPAGLSLGQLRNMQAAIQGNTMPKEDFKITKSREYGASFVCSQIMKALKVDKAIYSRPSEEWVRACLAMIAGRLVFAGSKLSLSHCGSYSALWEVFGIDNADVNVHCYAAMDKLLERQEDIQQTLAKKHLHDGTLVLYDITSCYMEGEYADSELVEFGYNRDRKRGHEQIVISLLCTRDGCPVAVDVFAGNTKDETTVLDKIEEIHTKYGVENIIFVGDRGMVTQTKYENIDHETTKVISALSHNAIKTLDEKGTIQIGMFDEKNIVEVIDGDKRYCLCKNPEMEAKEAATRQVLLKKTCDDLDQIIKCTKKTKYTKEMRAGKAVNKYKMGKFIVFEGSGENLKYTINYENVEREARLDGCYIVYTDVPPEIMTAIQTVENYKSLMHVEQAFRNMKTVHLELRPIFHKTDDRIRCHVFICMLAYYVMWHINQKLQPFFETDGVGALRKFTFNYVFENLKSIRKETIEICGVQSYAITTPTDEPLNILQLLEVRL